MAEFDVFATGLNDLAKYLKKMKLSLEKVGIETVEECLKEAERRIIQNASIIEFTDERVATQTMNQKSFLSRGKVTRGRIINMSQHATYVEYGTGMVGEENPYPYGTPYPESGMGYNVLPGKKRYNEKLDRYFWFYGGKPTDGMPSYHIMYTSAKDVERDIGRIASKVIERKLKK